MSGSIASRSSDDEITMNDEHSIPSLVANARNGIEDERDAAIEALLHLGEAGIDGLIELARDSNWEIRRSVAIALGNTGSKRAIEPLLKLIGDDDKSDDENRVNRTAARALNNLGELSLEPVLDELRNQTGKDRRRRYWIAMSLGLRNDTKAVDSLIQVLTDGDRVVVEGAVCALMALGDCRALEPLKELRKQIERGTYLQHIVDDAIRRCNSIAGSGHQ